MVDIVRQSITELCREEYRTDPAILSRWLDNKTSANFLRWISDRRHLVVVAEGSSGLMGVGMVAIDGEIQLNYVAPQSRFQGVSKALVRAMEEYARALGLSEVRLHTSKFASRMYTSLGYEAVGAAESRFCTLPGIYMRKAL
jgi:GNAT superfamily N-acetyltransferase